MTRDDFEREYPEAEATSTVYVGQEGIGQWLTEDYVQVAEYYCCEYSADELLELTTGQTVLRSQLADAQLLALALQVGFTERQRPVQRTHVRWYKLTAVDLLDERELPG